jgi:hypothetical protein
MSLTKQFRRRGHGKLRRFEEAGADELLDDWMVSGPADPPSSD